MSVDFLGNNPEDIRERLLARLSRGEFFALALALSMVGVFTWYQIQLSYSAFDLGNYLKAARGDFSHYYYAYWFVPVFWVVDLLPPPLNYVFWNILNLMSIFFTSRLFKGKTPWVVLSYQMLYSLFQGQITGIVLGGIGLCYWGILKRRWHWAGLGVIIALTKVQLGLVPVLCLVWFSDISWKEKWRVIFIPLGLALSSLVVYPGWPLQLLETIRQNPPNAEGSISLWRWLGPLSFSIWLPPLFLKLASNKRFYLFLAANALGLPYFQQNDILLLFVLPTGWLVLLGNLGYLFAVVGWHGLQILTVVPGVLYVALLARALNWRAWIKTTNPK